MLDDRSSDLISDYKPALLSLPSVCPSSWADSSTQQQSEFSSRIGDRWCGSGRALNYQRLFNIGSLTSD